MLPKMVDKLTNGGVYLQKVRCGKANCRCSGGDLHEAYYFFRRVDGKMRKSYVPRDDVDEIRSIIAGSRAIRLLSRRIRTESIQMLKKVKLMNQEQGRLIGKSTIENE